MATTKTNSNSATPIWWRPALVLASVMASACVMFAQGAGSGDPRPASAIILDIDGDGVNLSPAAEGVDFDVDLGGHKSRVGWTVAGSDDAFLVVDRNRNGNIDDISEVVGTRFAFPGGARPASGAIGLMTVLQGITPLPNGDIPRPIPPDSGRIDKGDQIYSSLALWNDRNHNGLADTGELKSLESANVSSINNGYRAIQRTEPSGNVLALEGFFFLKLRGVDVRRAHFEVKLAR